MGGWVGAIAPVAPKAPAVSEEFLKLQTQLGLTYDSQIWGWWPQFVPGGMK